MKLMLRRKPVNGNALPGILQRDSHLECYTMENAELAIPPGTYPIELYDSPTHGKETPQLKNVPGRTNIQMHVANWPYQLKGCIALGQGPGNGCVNSSQPACDALFPKIRYAIHHGESVNITIV